MNDDIAAVGRGGRIMPDECCGISNYVIRPAAPHSRLWLAGRPDISQQDNNYFSIRHSQAQTGNIFIFNKQTNKQTSKQRQTHDQI